MTPLLIAEWLFLILIALLALGSIGVLAVSFGMCAVALSRRASTGEWPAWVGKAGATLAISATVASPVFAWVGYVATL